MRHDTNYYAGVAAENTVAQKYAASGYKILAQRYRVREGEIDIVARLGGELTFVEVKKSKSFERAAEMIGVRQINRIQSVALRYLQENELPLESPMRFDAALVDSIGKVKIIPNAFV